MRVIEIEGRALKPAQRNIPVPTENQVLIRVFAVGVNRPDVMQRQGLYPPPPGASDIPGLEIAGRVEASGAARIGPPPPSCKSTADRRVQPLIWNAS